MIFFDNAATTMQKPEEVREAVFRAIGTLGNCGRGAHGASLDAMRVVYETREQAAALFGLDNSLQVAFTQNSTAALNMAIKGLIHPGDHVITTVMEHNSVLRPLYEMEERGVGLSFVSCDEKGRLRCDELDSLLRPNTRAVICTHASNLTGNGVDAARIGRFCREHGLLFLLDASQSAGCLEVNMEELHADVICFTGHKGLYGPQGTGGLCVREGVEIAPMFSGGSGVHSYDHRHPSSMPARLEAGTLNGHGLAGLKAGIEFVRRIGVSSIRKREQELLHRFYQGISSVPGIKIYGDVTSEHHTGVIAFNLGAYDSGEVCDELMTRFEIAARPGAHCAPLMHKALGTVEQGAVRFSFSWFNTEDEVDRGIAAVRQLARE